MGVTATHCQLMAEYSHWMDQNLYRVCASIPDCDRRRDLGAFFRSIHGTRNHILFGDRIWLARLSGET
ncbi:MAG: DinB family protein [Synechococcus sp.]